MNIKTEKDEKTGQHYFNLNDFKEVIDISNVEFYQLINLPDGGISVAFFDKDRKQILPRELDGKQAKAVPKKTRAKSRKPRVSKKTSI